MGSSNHRSLRMGWIVCVLAGSALVTLLSSGAGTAQKPSADAKAEFASAVQPLLKKYCMACHSTKIKKGSLDLERFTSLDHVRKDLKPWQHMIEQLEAGEMPPKERPQ